MAKPANTLPTKAVHVAERAKGAKPAVSKPPAEASEKTTKALPKVAPPSAPEEPAPDDLQAIFGRNLRAARLKSGLKQSDIAERTGWTQQRLSLIEAGKQNLTLKTMMKLAQVVGHDVTAMLQRVQTSDKKK